MPRRKIWGTMGGKIITPTIGARRINLARATVGMVVATTTAGETVGTAATAEAVATTSALIMSSYPIRTTTVGAMDTTYPATTRTKSVQYDPVRQVGLR